MKKIFMTVSVLMLVFMVYSCSTEHDAPTFGVYSAAKMPTNVDASFSSDPATFSVSWDMTDDTNVTDYYVVISDSVNFNGTQISRATGSLETNASIPADFITVPDDVVDAYSTTRYFAVQAVYGVETEDGYTFFIGPRSDDTDSAEFTVIQ